MYHRVNHCCALATIATIIDIAADLIADITADAVLVSVVAQEFSAQLIAALKVEDDDVAELTRKEVGRGMQRSSRKAERAERGGEDDRRWVGGKWMGKEENRRDSCFLCFCHSELQAVCAAPHLEAVPCCTIAWDPCLLTFPCLPTCLPACPPACLPAHLPACLPTCLVAQACGYVFLLLYRQLVACSPACSSKCW